MGNKSPFGLKPRQLLRLLNIGKEEDANSPPPADASQSTAGGGAAPERLPSWIGRYRIIEILGEGGMGIVYLARQEHPIERTVAVKVIKPGMDTKQVIARFEAERQTLALLDHPHIAQVLDAGATEDGRPYFVMEYVRGIPITEYCDKYKLGTQERLKLFIPLCRAIQHAHHKGIIHRDIKPSNALVLLDDQTPIPKIIDFGVAKALNQRLTERTLFTEQGQLIGTPEYMSPEQAGLTGLDVDTRTDIYSLGVLLYELLTGCTPFDAQELRSKGYAEMERIIREQDPVKPSTKLTTLGGKLEDIAKHRSATVEQLRKSVRGDLDWIVMKAMEKDRKRRYETANSLVMDIEHHLNNEPILAGPPSKLYRFRKLVRRDKAVFAVVAVVAAVLCAIGLLAAGLANKKPVAPPSKGVRLVVLPFENLGSEEDEYFAAGLTDAITSRLAAIGGLAVISRQTAMQYKKGQKTAQQIADELRVDYILEGTVQREQPSDPMSRVRVLPQLIKASNDTHVWAQPYDTDMSEVFRVQSDLAEQVAQALNITLLERERQALQSRPTENMEAYNYYLRGNEYWHRSFLESDFRIAIRMYEKAVELDPEFALAYAQLSRCHAMMYMRYDYHTLERLEMAKEAVDRALQLEPDLPEAHRALANYYYRGHLDYDRALEQFAIARKNMPNDSDLLSGIGFVQRRQGKFEEALANIKRASELDPLSHNITLDLGATFTLMRYYPQGLRCYDKAISLAPDLPEPYEKKAWLYLLWEGSTKKARAVVEEALKNTRSPEEPWLVDLLIHLDVYEGTHQKALDRLSLRSEDLDGLESFIPSAMRYADIYRHMNDNGSATKYYDEGRNILEAKIRQQPDDTRFHSTLGIAYAGLGRREEAIREGQTGVDLLPITKEAMRGPSRVRALAQVYVMVGEFDLAIDQIEFLLSIPGPLSIPLLRLDPDWAPLREHPRFKRLLGTTE